MLFDSPMPFREAIESLLARDLLPTNMSSAELRGLGKSILDRSLFSARNHYTEILDQLKNELQTLLNPVTAVRPDGTPYTSGTDVASVRLRLRRSLEGLGYQAPEGKKGTIEDLASEPRLNLVIKTNQQIAQGYGYARQGQNADVLDEWPGQELVRLEERVVPRDDWDERWRAACQQAGDTLALGIYRDTGRMVARKDSGVWQALGDGAGGFDDTLGSPYEPFAFGSGMGTVDIDRAESVELGLIGEDEQVKAIPLNYALEVSE